MANGEFREASKHLSGILKNHPDDKEALQLAHTCREMIHIQNACSENNASPETRISAGEYFSVHYRRIMKKLCHFVFQLITLLPSALQQKIDPERFNSLENHYTVETDSQKDWLWEMLFWDARRRAILFTSLIVLILLFVSFFFLLVWGGNSKNSSPRQNFASLVNDAQENNADAQFQLGKSYYFGEGVKRDVDQALIWLTKASKKGNPQAAELLQKILIEQDVSLHKGTYLWNKKEKENHFK